MSIFLWDNKLVTTGEMPLSATDHCDYWTSLLLHVYSTRSFLVAVTIPSAATNFLWYQRFCCYTCTKFSGNVGQLFVICITFILYLESIYET